ncbi:hypothetical protein [Pandoraea apista]|uniref:hypothetical protein n=1 Tax=Pandoraea apista TaxID=93218 RepID=UPI00058A8218|nr:hypothetical protein [Pandoraea apista]AJE97255.1 hypothetical protein SG18_02075 [Pandoraea apista]AKH71220.1 hypothetical protein XM39_02075 [Pandoraea apista]AKI63492.1 hypothetical protein AA956_19395 [Pandoraea apista]
MKIEEWLADVEMKNGIPVVLSKYGFKKIVVDGKTYLEARSKEELLADLEQDTTRSEEERDGLIASIKADYFCFGDAFSACSPGGACKRCEKVYGGPQMGWFCRCAG